MEFEPSSDIINYLGSINETLNISMTVEFPAIWPNMGDRPIAFDIDIIIDGNGAALKSERFKSIFEIQWQGMAAAYKNDYPPDPDRTVIGTVKISFNQQGLIGEAIVYSDRSIEIVCHEVLSYPVSNELPYDYLKFKADHGIWKYINQNYTNFVIPIYVILPWHIEYGDYYQYIANLFILDITSSGINSYGIFYSTAIENYIDPNEEKVVTAMPYSEYLWKKSLKIKELLKGLRQ